MSSGSEAEDDWEDVEPGDPLHGDLTEEQLLLLAKSHGSCGQPSTSSGIEFTLDKNALKKKRKEKSEFERAFEAFQKELLHNVHKTHLLCLVSRGIHQTKLCDHSPSLQAILLSLIANQRSLYRDDPSRYDRDLLLKLLKWFVAQKKDFQKIVSDFDTRFRDLSVTLLLVALLRVLGLETRLVMVLNPLSYKPMSTSKKKNYTLKKSSPNETVKEENVAMNTVSAVLKGSSSKRIKNTTKKCTKKLGTSSSDKRSSTTETDTSPYFNKSMKHCSPPRLRKRTHSNLKSSSESFHSESENEDKEFTFPKPKKMKIAPKKVSRKITQVDSEVLSSKVVDYSRTIEAEADNDDVMSWVEVYVCGEEKWVSAHIPSCSVGQPHLCERDCPLPLNYVLAFQSGGNLEGVCVRDVTPRYASDWCTRVYKQRLDRDWWAESLRPFELSEIEARKREDEDIIDSLHSQPLPSSVSDYKNHPLYALKRHLLKFEAIYPESSEVLGFCRGEAVFARKSVYTLHTRETWLKEGRLVRVGEVAYKSVKARPKKGQPVPENQLATVDVFGSWQTEKYIPQPIVDGKVPRNEYGNVELFLPSMLPPGGVHIKIQGVQKVARKLGIDFAPAMMGWDFHGGFCHPIIEGIVVAMENEGVILEGWEQEEQIRMEKANKKREKRVVGSWRRVTKALLIKERLRAKYDYS